MEILYKADDGRIFFNEDECYEYENSLKHPHFRHIFFYDKDDNIRLVNEGVLFDDSIYHYTEKVYIHNEDELKDFHWVAEECGWCEWEKDGDIDSPGIWVRKETDWTHDGVWKKEK